MKQRVIYTLLIIYACAISVFAQSNDNKFVLGADLSWVTEQESRGQKFYNYNGEERDAFALMKEMGLDMVRLRVWVDPSKHGNWCDKNDVLNKAKRAKALGMGVMIDFHYSDWWADPAKQNIPAAWAKHKYKVMLQDLKNHTTEVLQLLKDNGIEPEWVQVGNETSNGMLWSVEVDPVTGWEKKDEYGNTTIVHSMGHLQRNPEQYAGFFAAGYDATKAVFPKTKVIVHLDNGFDPHLYNRNLDVLKNNGCKWDIIGMSIYPYWARQAKMEDSAARTFADMKQNINKVVSKYGTDVMIVETGFEVDEQNPWKMAEGREQLANLIRICRDETEGHCRGVVYWEPTAKPKQYKLGAFTGDGHPTDIMRAFTMAAMRPSFKAVADNNVSETEGGKASVDGKKPANDGKKLLPQHIKYDRPLLAMETTEGTIIVELYNETPKHRDNYLWLARTGALDSMLFHRVIRNFMIQCGDPKSKTADATTTEWPCEQLGNTDVLGPDGKEYFLDAEILYPRFFHKRGALAAAREGDAENPERKSSASQFYIVWGEWPVHRQKNQEHPVLEYYDEPQQAGTPWLDGKYTIFGEVVEGLDVVDKIQKHRGDKYDRPVDDVRLMRFYVVE